MPQVIINKWDGGHAEDVRSFATNESEKSLNFDIFTNPNKLIPYEDSIAETVDGTMDDIELADVEISDIAGTYYLTASGFESGASAKSEFFTKASPFIEFSPQATGPSGVHQKGSGVTYKDKFYSVSISGTTLSLNRYNSAGSVTQVGTTTIVAGSLKVRPFVHPEDNVLYVVIQNIIIRWDGTTYSSTNTLLPDTHEATSMTDYGAYLAIAVHPLRGNGKSVVYLWGRDMTLNTFQGMLNFGEGDLKIIENLNNDLIGIMQSWGTINSAYTPTTTKIQVKGYFGGTIETIKELQFSSLIVINGVLKFKNKNRLYFSTDTDAVYVVGKNKSGRYIITKDRYLLNGAAMNPVSGLAMIGDIMWSGGYNVSNVYVFMRTKTSSVTYASTSTYKTTINPSMPINDRGENKQLRSVRIYYTGKSSGTVVVKYAVDTGTMTSILSESTTEIEDMKQTTMQADGQAFNAGKEIQFQIESTGGVEIKALEYEYDILNQ
jgi:hypothetical protein